MSIAEPLAHVWRVCVTRDEDADGPLAQALRAEAFEPVACPVLVEAPPEDPHPLVEASRHLERYGWIICASVRGVHALARSRGDTWPRGPRTAAVGAATARALVGAGADPPPLRAPAEGATPLWAVLEHACTWTGTRVLVPTTPGGRRVLIDRLRDAGARVDAVDAYRMVARDAGAIARDWARAAPDAAVVASPRAAIALVDSVGVEALRALRCVAAIGATTGAALAEIDVPHVVAEGADFARVARAVRAARARQAGP